MNETLPNNVLLRAYEFLDVPVCFMSTDDANDLFSFKYKFCNPAASQVSKIDLSQFYGVSLLEVHGPAATPILKQYQRAIITQEKVQLDTYYDDGIVAEGMYQINVYPIDEKHVFVIYHNRSAELTVKAAFEARKVAENALAMKTAFTATLSHEIRTPLHGILGMLQLFSDTDLSAVQTEFVRTAMSCANTLMTLVNGVLDLSQSESTELTLAKEPFSVFQCLDSVMDVIAVPALRRGLQVYATVDPSAWQILCGDQYRLTQILLNIVGNAVKFTDSGFVRINISNQVIDPGSREQLNEQIYRNSPVLVSAEPILFDPIPITSSNASASASRPHGDDADDNHDSFLSNESPSIDSTKSHARQLTEESGENASLFKRIRVVKSRLVFSVRDTGPGITADEVASLFQPFHQTSFGRKRGGSGLGLTVSKSLCERLGGGIKMEGAPGKGTEVTFWIPSISMSSSTAVNFEEPLFQMSHLAPLAGRRALLVADVLDSPNAGQETTHLSFISHLLSIIRINVTCTSWQSLSQPSSSSSSLPPCDIVLVDVVSSSPTLIRDRLQQANLIDVPLALIFAPELLSSVGDISAKFIMKPLRQRQLHATLLQLLQPNQPESSMMHTDQQQYRSINTPSTTTAASDPFAAISTNSDLTNHDLTSMPLDVRFRYHALCVDDNEINLTVIRRLLEALKVSCDVTSTGEDALDKCTKTKFDIVFMDLNLPGMNGIEATRAIHNINLNHNTPIVALTAHQADHVVASCLEAGMVACVSKPITKAQLANIIRKSIIPPQALY